MVCSLYLVCAGVGVDEEARREEAGHGGVAHERAFLVEAEAGLIEGDQKLVETLTNTTWRRRERERKKGRGVAQQTNRGEKGEDGSPTERKIKAQPTKRRNHGACTAVISYLGIA